MVGFEHTSVLLDAAVDQMAPCAGGLYVDATLGGGGHALNLLKRTAPSGRVCGFDRDPRAIEAAKQRLEAYGDRLQVRLANYDQMDHHLDPCSADGVLMDLGISSPQVDVPERGFSFQKDGPLDMRMSEDCRWTAEHIVNEWSMESLRDIFRLYGEEPRARRMAQAIVVSREAGRLRSTVQLAQLLESAMGGRFGAKNHPATRVFQALRIVVNEELHHFKQGLEAAWRVLRPGARLVVITFQSLEVVLMKVFGDYWSRDYLPGDDRDTPALRRPCVAVARWHQRKAVKPSPEEIERNPRARSAQMRVIEKLDDLPLARAAMWTLQPKVRYLLAPLAEG